MASIAYTDTRGNCTQQYPFTQAVVEGLAPGGGLFVPCEIPHLSLDEILSLADMPYAKRAAFVYQVFGVDLPSEKILRLMEQAYGDNFDTSEICPVTALNDDTFILELWHGPTSAFKDMALQCLPRFFSASAELLRERGQLSNEYMILVATSGDTGKAALEGFCDVPGVSIGVLYPHGGVSDIQYKQMATQKGNNVHVWGVKGNFDDCQTAVKSIFNDETFAQKLSETYNIALSSANSINWGRLLPQVVYYISAYAQLVKAGHIEAGQKIDVCVPTGNFGNILAAWYAREMGTPIESLICASNENHVLTDFIQTGVYDISNREFMLTPSPSMDILVSSNLERQLFELCGRNTETIAAWMNDLTTKKRFEVNEDTKEAFKQTYRAGWATNEECLATIRETYQEYGYLADPHTAVGLHVANKQRSNNPVLVASTAHWAKFGNNVYRALHNIAPGENLPDDVSALSGCELNNRVSQETGNSSVPLNLANLDTADIRFKEVIDSSINGIMSHVESFLSSVAK